MKAKIGDQDTCRLCHKPIEYNGKHWQHIGSTTPRHPATPTGDVDVPDEPNNLKLTLMELGNRLVTQHRFDPAAMSGDPELVADPELHSTRIIALFTEFVNCHPEAQQILMELGFAWPVVERPSHGRAQ